MNDTSKAPLRILAFVGLMVVGIGLAKIEPNLPATSQPISYANEAASEGLRIDITMTSHDEGLSPYYPHTPYAVYHPEGTSLFSRRIIWG